MADEQILPGGWRLRGGVLIPPDFANQGATPPPDQLGSLRAARDFRTPSYAPRGPQAPMGPQEPPQIPQAPMGPQEPPEIPQAPMGPPEPPPKMTLSDPILPPKDVMSWEQQKAFSEMQAYLNANVIPAERGGASSPPGPPDDTQGRIAGLEKIRGRLGLARALGQGGNTIARGFMTLGRVPQNVTSGNDLGGFDQTEGQLNSDLGQLRGQLPQGLRKTLGIGDQKFPGGLSYDQFAKIQPTLVAGENRKSADLRASENRKAADTRLQQSDNVAEKRRQDAEEKFFTQNLAAASRNFESQHAKLIQEGRDFDKAQEILSGNDVGPQAVQISARSLIRSVESGRLTDKDVDAQLKLPGFYAQLRRFSETGLGGQFPPEVIAGMKKLAISQGALAKNQLEHAREEAALRAKGDLEPYLGAPGREERIGKTMGLH